MAIYDDDDALYDFENDERLSVEAKVALGMMREQHVTLRYFLRLLADFLGTDVAAKAQEFSHLTELARLKQPMLQKTVQDLGAQRLKVKSSTNNTNEQEPVVATEPKKDVPLNESKPKTPPISKSNKDISSVPKKTLASKNSRVGESNGSGGAKG
jgi:hypothetical protein